MRARSKSKDLQQEQGVAPQSAAAKSNDSSNQDQRNPLLKFFQDSGSWIAEKYQQTTESIGNTAQRVGDAASELWDVASSTDLSLSNGGLGVTTDLDEVMDLLPSDLGVMLDREASENNVQLHFSKDGSITIDSPSLAIGSVNVDGMQIGNTILNGVHIHIRRERNGLIPKINPDESQITLKVDSAVGENIVVQGDSGPISAKEVELKNLHVVMNGKQAPFDDQPAGNIQFNVGSAVIRGFNGMGANASNISAQATSGSLSEESGNINAGSVQAKDISYAGNSAATADIGSLNASFAQGNNGYVGNVTAGHASATGLDSSFGTLDGAAISDLQASGNLADQSFNSSVGNLSASGITSDYGSVQEFSTNGLVASGDIDDQQFSAKANALDVLNGSSSAGSVGSAHVSNAHISANKNNITGGFGDASVHQAAAEFGSIDSGTMQNVAFDTNGQNHSASIGAATIHNGTSDFGSVESAGGQNLVLQSDGQRHSATVGHASIQGGSSEFGNVGQASINDVILASDGSNHNASIASGSVEQLSAAQGSVGSATFQTADFTSDGTTHSADIASASANNLYANNIGSIGSISTKGMHASSGPNGLHGNVDSLHAKQLAAGGLTVNEMHASQLIASQNDDVSRAQLASASLQGTHMKEGDSHINIGNASFKNGSIQQDQTGTNFHLDSGSASNINLHASGNSTSDSSGSSSSSGSGASSSQNELDIDSLISSSAQRIESGNINASIQLNPGKIGPATIKDGTVLQTNLDIADNQIQNGSRIQSNQNIQGPLWTSVNGAYVDKNQLMGDINGFFDLNVSKHINGAMGLDGKELHSIGDYANSFANPQNASSSSSSSSSSDSSSDSYSPVDLSSLSANGNIQLSNGQLDAGIASANLAGTQAGDNQVSFASEKGTLAAEFARFITSSISINTDTVNMSAESGSISEGSVTMQADKQELDGTIGNIQIEGIDGSLKNTSS